MTSTQRTRIRFHKLGKFMQGINFSSTDGHIMYTSNCTMRRFSLHNRCWNTRAPRENSSAKSEETFILVNRLRRGRREM